MRWLILALLASAPLTAAPPTTCGLDDPYSAALCAYQHRNFAAAEKGFRAIIEANDDGAHVVKSMYFLARTDMKLGRFDQASSLLIRIYATAPGFYREWNCDFLLGECRRAVGREN